VLDRAREQQVLAKKRELLSNPMLEDDVTLLFEAIMSISRRQQHQLMEEKKVLPQELAAEIASRRAPIAQPKVVYQGVPGAYSEIASRRFFGTETQMYGVSQFEDVFIALREGEADYGVLPIENSSTGGIRQVYDLLTHYNCWLVGETKVTVEHCLLGTPEAELADVADVYSHEQGLFQCEPYLAQHPQWQKHACANTAASAQFVAQSGDRTKAAIASERAAEIYGLKILDRDIHYNTDNATRFVVVSPRPELREGRNKIETVITLPHRAGSLHDLLTIFAVHGLNLLRLESRPIPGKSWEYMFFLEFSGDLLDPEIPIVLEELAQNAADVRILGNFAADGGNI